MNDNGMIYFAKKGPEERPNEKIYLNPAMANRHGFIGGATGTGKSVTLKVLAESFSQLGVPTFFSDVKGDMAGIAVPGQDSEGMQKRLDRFEIRDQFEYRGFPVTIYDIYGKKGIPLRTTVCEMGPQLMAQILDLNDTQTDLLSVAYKIADDQQMLLIDTKDLKAMLTYLSEHAAEFETDYGHMAKTSLATIIRSIVALEAEGADTFFGEPAINITDFFTLGPDGRGMVNILDSEVLISKPKLYSAFMLYLLSELFEILPEVGDIEKPKMVFFFDEAHCLFNNASKPLLEKIEQVVKLIRSKGIGLFFITQSPGDIPASVMAQLGNKIEHGLHAYTPAEQKVVKAAAESFRENPEFDTEEVLKNLGTGEAVVSTLDEKGAPSVAEYAYILPPESSMSAISDETRDKLVKESILYTRYAAAVDNDSAYEILNRMKAQVEEAKAQEAAQAAQQAQEEKEAKAAAKEAEKEAKAAEKKEKKKQTEADKIKQNVAKTTGGSVGREVGKVVGEAVFGKKGKTIFGNIGSTIGRNLMGTLMKGK